MLFNSIDFILFFPIAFAAIWIFKSWKAQNVVIVLASYVFYGWWDWRFLSLIFFSTVIDFVVGKQLQKTESTKSRKRLLLVSIITNIGLLGFFKYYNFFLDNFVSAFTFFGRELEVGALSIILPVGISFYTFQTMSYTIDIYRKKINATESFLSFMAFVSFFPQLVAGPIERASRLLPQFTKRRQFDYIQATDGMRQILWGLFKKVVIADNCAVYVDAIFNDPSQHSSLTLGFAAVLFTIQIYCDFSGYSDMAIGLARLLGFNLMQNFAFPFFSRDIAEFWRRWHISLSTWFRDYVYIPLGGSHGGIYKKVSNVLIVFVVSGFWHGANWTFIVWGLLNALYFLPLILLGNNRLHLDTVGHGKMLPTLKDLVRMLFTFSLTVFAFVFFRAADIGHAFDFILGIFASRQGEIHLFKDLVVIIGLGSFMLIIEWFGREGKHALENLVRFSRFARWGFYILLLFIIGMFMPAGETPFIYFQF